MALLLSTKFFGGTISWGKEGAQCMQPCGASGKDVRTIDIGAGPFSLPLPRPQMMSTACLGSDAELGQSALVSVMQHSQPQQLLQATPITSSCTIGCNKLAVRLLCLAQQAWHLACWLDK